MGRCSPRASELGQALLLSLCVLVMALVITLLVVHLAGQSSEASRAQSVADLVALAGVADGKESAAEVARANGATLTVFSSHDGGVTVSVAIAEVVATASAVLEPG